jgi:23S rRNA (pseudouridine1915-N3)-methyltransferase
MYNRRARGRSVYPIRLVTVGRPKLEPILALEKHYKKLLGTYARLDLVEVQGGKGEGEPQLLSEAKRIGGGLSGFRRRALLCPDGASMGSEQFASWLGARMDRGESLAFAIGSSCGFHQSLRAEVGERISLGPMTFPHDLVRVMFLEQLYRAFTILNGRPYHK